MFVSDAAPELEDWIAGERARLRGLAARAAWMASELPANRDRVGELVRQAVHWSGDDECALRRALKVLDGMGDRAGAAALYDEFARRVKRDFDVELSSETRSVLKALRARRASGHHDAPPAPTMAPVAAAATEPPRRQGKRLLRAGIAGALLVLALAAYIGPRGNAARGLSTDAFTVTPFRVPETDSTLAWLSDGLVQMLTVRLGGAAGLGAGRRVEGSVTGTRQHLILGAFLSGGTGSLPTTRTTVEGSADSIPQMADRLAAQLLGMNAGLESERLALLADVPLPAVRIYLAGLAASRRGDMENALQLYNEAVALDSFFTLAGLQICRSPMWNSSGTKWETGCRTARRGREQLSPADRALLDANPPAWAGSVEMFAGLNAAVVGYPDRPENWYALGDAHFRTGELSGEERWAERAGEAYRRGWLLDSADAASTTGEPRIAEPILHMVELAQLRHDTAEVVRLAGSVLAVDSTSDLARIVTWHRALVTSDSAREAFWSGIGSASQKVTMFIILFIHGTGMGWIDEERARTEDYLRLRSHNPGFAPFAFSLYALNAGRPDDIAPESPRDGPAAHGFHRVRIQRALSWDADTMAALESVRILGRSIDAPASGEGARQQLFDLCTVGEWQASRGNYAPWRRRFPGSAGRASIPP